MYRIISLVLVTLGLSTIASAEPQDYEFDMSHSRIFFDVSHRGYSTMLGRFKEFAGTFRFDADDPTATSLDITIDSASVDMFHAGLNEHLKTDDFFDVDQYPKMQFVSERVERTAENEFSVHGRFTLLGQTHPLSLDVILNQTGEARDGAAMAGFTANATLDRALYGMRYGLPLVGADIDIRIEIEARASQSGS